MVVGGLLTRKKEKEKLCSIDFSLVSGVRSNFLECSIGGTF